VHEVPLPGLDDTPPPEPRETISREGQELPSHETGDRDPWPWLVGPSVAVVALMVLWFSLRPPKGQRHHPR